MEKLHGKKKSIAYILFLLAGLALNFLLVIVPVALIAMLILDCMAGNGSWAAAAFLVVLFAGSGVLCIFVTLYVCKVMQPNFRINDTGLWVKFPMESEQFIPWEDFQEVCVCTTRHKFEVYPVICFAKKGAVKKECRWQPDGKKRNVIFLNYSPELLAEVKAKYPYDIPDLRDTLPYRRF